MTEQTFEEKQNEPPLNTASYTVRGVGILKNLLVNKILDLVSSYTINNSLNC